MENVVNTVLYCYPSFQEVIDGMEKLAYFKAVVSFCDSNKTVEQIDKILQINEQKSRLLRLKSIVEDILSELTDEERLLIEAKYSSRGKIKGHDYCLRHYYRKQNMIFNKIVKLFKARGYDEKWLSSNFFDIYFIKAKYLSIKKITKKNKVANSKSIHNI